MQEIALKFNFKLLSTMSLTSFTVDDKELDQDTLMKLRKADDTISGELIVRPATDEVYVEIDGVGTEPHVKGTFNLAIGKVNVFNEDQDLLVNSLGRISFVKTNVKLPL